LADVLGIQPEHAPATEADGALARLQDQLKSAEQTNAAKSMLRIAIDKVSEPFHHSSAAVENLRKLSKNSASADFGEKTKEAIVAEKQAQQRERDTYSVADSALRSLGMFTAKRLGFWLSGAVSALDEIKPHDSDHIIADASLGFTKGVLERQVNFSLAKRGLNPTMVAIDMGVGNRFIDTALTRTNLVDKSGDISWTSLGQGLFESAKAAASSAALKGDLATAVIAYPLTRSLSATFAGNSFRRAATTGFVYGYSQGLVDELQSSKNDFGGDLFSSKESIEHLALYPIVRGVASSLGAMPGGQRQYVKDWAWENSVKSRNREYQLVSINPADVQAINAAKGKPVNVNVNVLDSSMAFKPAESISIGKQKVPTDWYSRFFDTLKMKGFRQSPEPQMRFISREPGQPDSLENQWQMVTAPGFKTIGDLARKDPLYDFQKTKIDKMVPSLKEPLVSALGSGTESWAYQTAGGPVLKITDVSRYKDIADWGKLPFDSMTLSDQFFVRKIPDKTYRGSNVDGTLMYLQEFAKMNGTQEQAADLRQQMADQKVNFHDFNFRLRGDQVSWATDQFGFRRIEDPAKGQPAKIEPIMVDYGARSQFFQYDDTQK